MKIVIPISAIDRAIAAFDKIGEAADHIGHAAENLTPDPKKWQRARRSLRWWGSDAWASLLSRVFVA